MLARSLVSRGANAKTGNARSFLENIFNSSVTAMTVLNDEGKLAFANAGAERVLGLSTTQHAVNRLSYDDPQWQIQSLDGQKLSKTELPFWQVKTSGKPVFDVRHSIVWPDGQWRALSVNGAPFISDDQQTQYVFSVQDISQQILASRALEYNEFRLRTLFKIAQRTQLVETGRYGPYEKEYLRKDGSRYPVLLNGILVTDNQGHQLIWSIVEDISERKRLARMKDEFVSTVSHELRTPLTAINGGLDLLQTVVHSLPESMQPLLTIAQRNSRKLLGLVNDLLDMEKLLAGKITLNSAIYPVRELVLNAADNMQSYAKLHQLTIECQIVAMAPQITVDQARFEQVMANLLSNALKFSQHGQTVVIKVTEQHRQVRIEVQDQGAGIPTSFQQRVFQKFAQADSSDSRQKSGSGLGLAISRELVERMGGTIGFTSQEGIGTTFWLEWPVV